MQTLLSGVTVKHFVSWPCPPTFSQLQFINVARQQFNFMLPVNITVNSDGCYTVYLGKLFKNI